MDILIERKDIAAFLDEKARRESARKKRAEELEIFSKLLGPMAHLSVCMNDMVDIPVDL